MPAFEEGVVRRCTRPTEPGYTAVSLAVITRVAHMNLRLVPVAYSAAGMLRCTLLCPGTNVPELGACCVPAEGSMDTASSWRIHVEY